MNNLLYRWSKAIHDCGGAAGLLALPQPVKEILKNTDDLKVKTEMLELIARQKEK